MDPLRKLLIAGVNSLLAEGKISLDAPAEDKANNDDYGHIFVEILGRPSVVMWRDIGFAELRVSVWWDYDHNQHPQANLTGNSREEFKTSRPLAKRQHYPRFVGAVASGWLERQAGKYLQGSGRGGIFDQYTRRDRRSELVNAASPVPEGFRAEGVVHM